MKIIFILVVFVIGYLLYKKGKKEKTPEIVGLDGWTEEEKVSGFVQFFGDFMYHMTMKLCFTGKKPSLLFNFSIVSEGGGPVIIVSIDGKNTRISVIEAIKKIEFFPDGKMSIGPELIKELHGKISKLAED